GELYIGGANLARGYLNRPGLTAERFIPNPFSTSGQRLYRTGDLVRYLDDSRLEFLGRKDSQVKLRGFRIELGEIEAVLGQHESVSACVVMVRQDPFGEQRVVAYVVPREEQTIAAAELRNYLRERLPVYMIPTTFVTLEALPVLSSGKLDRKALPAPEDLSGTAEREYVAPRTPVEEMLAGIFAEVLKIDRVSADDNFFDLGGHSLLATRVVSRINEAYPQAVSLRHIFEKPTLAEIALLIEQTQAVKSDPPTLITAQPRRRKDRAGLLENLVQLSDQEAREILTQRKQSIN
ncbi:MAG TPA: phosphopantetheine-binding protein, partial [Pyrinomonadaceae bacterium]|nr:phosphopantetheine-binding protein [Pyrinomonadaceae bacterium]